MNVKVHGKDVSVSPKTEDNIRERLAFLDQYFIIDEDDVANCVLKKVGNEIRIEITINTKAGILRAEETNVDLRTALDEVTAKLQRQIITQKNRLNRRHRSSLAKSFVDSELEEDAKDIPVRTKLVVAERMSLDEAILQMEMIGHSFFVYTDEEDGQLSIVYHRYDGGYGVLDVRKEE